MVVTLGHGTHRRYNKVQVPTSGTVHEKIVACDRASRFASREQAVPVDTVCSSAVEWSLQLFRKIVRGIRNPIGMFIDPCWGLRC
jgi:hypothetical protein